MAPVLAAVVVGVVATVALVVAVVSRRTGAAVRDVQTFAAPVRSLACALDAGSIVVTAAPADGAVVRRVLRYTRRPPRLVETLEDGRLVLEAHAPTGRLAGPWWVEYEVHVPETVTIDARTTAGRLSVTGVHGNLDLTSDAGKVQVVDGASNLHLTTSAGAIEGTRLRCSTVDARTDAGHVLLAFADAPSRVDVTAHAGAVDVRLPGGPYRVDASSSAGRERVTVPTDEHASRTVQARSHAGSVHVVPTGAGPDDLDVDVERLDEPAGAALVDSLLEELFSRYGEEDADEPHADELTPPDGVFLVARRHGRAVGCGGLRRVDAGVGEIKRMYVVPDARGSGVGRALLDAIEQRARAAGYRRLVLETGVRQPEAIGLYERSGYDRIANYPPYEDAPLSVCFEKRLRDA